jgi:Flp pilus assembly protein TadD
VRRCICLSALIALELVVGCQSSKKAAPTSTSARAPALLTYEEQKSALDAAVAALDAKDYQKARDLIEPVIRSDPKDMTAVGVRGRANVGLGNLQDAIKDLSAAVVAEPDGKELRISLAEAYDRAGNPAAAEPHAAAAAKLLADDEWAYYADGLLLIELKRYPAAVTALTKADSLAPLKPEILLALGEALMGTGKPMEGSNNAWAAIEALSGEGTESSPRAAPATKGPSKAPTDAGRSLGVLNPDEQDLAARAYELMARARIADASGPDRTVAKEIARSILDDIPRALADKDLAAFHQARAWREANLPQEALAAISGKTPPDIGWAQAELARVLLDSGRDFARAAQAAARAIELDGATGELLGLKGWAEFKAKSYREAVPDLEGALASARTKEAEALAHYRLFRGYEALGDAASARTHREAAKSLKFVEPM